MPRISFTENLKRHVPCPPQEVEGDTVRAVLEAAFAGNPPLRDYIVDDQNQLRKHVTIFVDGAMITDRAGLADAVSPNGEVYVFQALSGG